MRLPAAGLLPALRRYLGLTQPRLAELLGTSRVALAQAEAGRRLLPIPAQTALTRLLAALPPTLQRTLSQAPGYALPPPAPAPLVPTPPLPAPAGLAPYRHQAEQALRQAEASLTGQQARTAAGEARLALLAAPEAPDLGTYHTLFELEALSWTDAFAQAELRRLHARCEGLRRELDVLNGA